MDGIRFALSDNEHGLNHVGFVNLVLYRDLIKKILFVCFAVCFTIALLTLDSFAITGFDSWKALRSSEDVIIQQPTFAGVFGPEGLFNACTTDDEFKSIRPVRNCVFYRTVKLNSERGISKDYVCAAYETKQVSISRTFIQNICVRYSPMSAHSSGECIEYESVILVYPTTFSFPVFERRPREYGEFLFSKTFALQSCD